MKTRDREQITLDLLSHSQHLLGWLPGPPPWAMDAAQIDTSVAAEAECPDCGQQGLDCAHWHRPPRGYMAIMLCRCGFAEEI